MPRTEMSELRRKELEARADEYVAELVAEVGEPAAAELASAEEIVANLGHGSKD